VAILGVDVGGTFTDAVLVDEGRIRTAKVPTATGQEESVLAAARAVGAGAGLTRFAHGTTVATNALLERLEEAVGWDAICTADGDPARAKPSPALYLEALAALEVAPDEAAAFEDSPNGVRAAKAAGVYCVAVPNEVTRELGLAEAGADLVLDSLADLPPEALFSRLEEE